MADPRNMETYLIYSQIQGRGDLKRVIGVGYVGSSQKFIEGDMPPHGVPEEMIERWYHLVAVFQTLRMIHCEYVGVFGNGKP